MQALTEREVAELVRENPGWSRVFESHGIDYCCGGDTPLRRAAEENGISPEKVVEDLEAFSDDEPHILDWSDQSTEEIVEHIIESHHNYLREELPRLKGLVRKVANARGSHSELFDIKEIFEQLSSELREHIEEEETEVFPVITGDSGADGELGSALSKLKTDHRETAQALSELSKLSDGFEPPADACNSYRALYKGLKELEQDIHLHVHEENNVLFPRVQLSA